MRENENIGFLTSNGSGAMSIGAQYGEEVSEDLYELEVWLSANQLSQTPATMCRTSSVHFLSLRWIKPPVVRVSRNPPIKLATRKVIKALNCASFSILCIVRNPSFGRHAAS
jgi:hypothetical protein